MNYEDPQNKIISINETVSQKFKIIYLNFEYRKKIVNLQI